MKEINDLINAGFTIFGAGLYWVNIIKLWNDRQIKGISWGVQLFFTVWNAWTIYYYTELNQWVSFIAGIILFIGSIVWCTLAFRFDKNDCLHIKINKE